MPDKIEELLERQDELKQQLALVTILLAAPEWKWLEKILTTNVGIQRRQEFDRGIDSLDSAFASAWSRGVIHGLQLAVTTPLTHKETVEVDLEHLAALIQDAQDDRAN